MTDSYGPADALADLADWFGDGERWTQLDYLTTAVDANVETLDGEMVYGTDEVIQTCLVGGVHHVLWRAVRAGFLDRADVEGSEVEGELEESELYGRVVKYLRSAASLGLTSSVCLEGWNDASGRTVGDVREAIDIAWRDAKADGAADGG